MNVTELLDMALRFEQGLATLYRRMAESLDESTREAYFFRRLSDEEFVHARVVSAALEGCPAGATVAGMDEPELRSVLEMIDDISDDVDNHAVRLSDALEILEHIETFAEERFYGAMPELLPGVSDGFVAYLRGTCQGHASQLEELLAARRREASSNAS